MMRSVLKAFAHKVVFPVVEFLNVGALKVARLASRPLASKLLFTGNDAVLVIAPHPDDETLGCGGTIGLHLQAGDKVSVVIVTDGRRSRAGGLDPRAVVEHRTQEAQRAMDVVGRMSTSEGEELDLQQFQLPEAEWKNEELVGRLERLIGEMKPTIIYATSYVDFHPEHLRVAYALAQVLKRTSKVYKVKVRAYELQVPLTQMLANVISDIQATYESKQEALAQYRTQSGSFLWVRRYSRYLRAVFNTEIPIEVFWEMSAAQYVAVHGEPPTGTAFRSIRLRPFTDLAAWIIGSRKRRDYLSVASKGRSAGD